MTEYQNKLIEQHLFCVKMVLGTRIVVPNLPLMEYEDLFQVGSLALCKAATTYSSDRGEFKTYACTVIFNEIVSYIKHMSQETKRTVEQKTEEDGELYPFFATYDAKADFEAVETESLAGELRRQRDLYSGITRQGIIALEMKLLGYSTAEIAQLFGTTGNNVNAWISRAKNKLRNDQDFVAKFR